MFALLKDGKILFLLLSSLLLNGCAAQMVVKRGNGNVANAPINEAKGGTVRYGYDMSRASAYQQMKEYCEGPYKITKEEARNESVAGGFNAYRTNYVYIDFECVDQSEVK